MLELESQRWYRDQTNGLGLSLSVNGLVSINITNNIASIVFL